jgi:hypothetical protein
MMKQKSSFDVYVKHKKESEGRPPNDMGWIFKNPYLFIVSIILSLSVIFTIMLVGIGIILTTLYYHNNQKKFSLILGITTVVGIIINLIITFSLILGITTDVGIIINLIITFSGFVV